MNSRIFRLPLAVMLLAAFLLPSAFASSAPSVYGDALVPVLASADDAELLEVVILMNPRPDTQELQLYLEGVRSIEQRRALLWDEVSRTAEIAQDDILGALYADEQLGQAESIRSIAINNSISAKLTPTAIRRLADRHDVNVIEYSPDVQCLEPVETSGTPGGNQTDEIAWHVNQVGAPDVWDMGYTGEGIIVAIMDTGVNYNHVDLADHLWDGGAEFPNHGYDVYSNDNDPMDYHGHGTHVAGIVASDGTAGTQAGIAPDATIMCVKIMSDGGGADLSDVWAGVNWAVEHGAHHTTISAGWYNISNALHQGNRDTYEVARLAGLTNTKSAGNSGGSSFNTPPEQVSAPGWVPSPWHNPDQTEPGGQGGLTVVGSTNSSDNISSYSSHGPVTWENIDPWFDYVYNNGQNQGLIKPDVSAPGEDINSCSYSNINGYTIKSGTSMASPCAGGSIALIRSINPNLTPEEVDEILQTTTVDLGATGKDNVFGAGRVDVYEAALLAEASMSDVVVNLDPLYEPYVVLQNGGTLIFDAEIRNNYTTATPGQVWTEAILPNGNTYPLDVYNVTFQPGVDIVVTGVQQNVPGFAPEGEYLYVAKAGQYPGTVIDQDSFVFLKFSLGADSEGDWNSTGWDLKQNAEIATAETMPGKFALGAAYPNPFNPTTTLNVTLPDAGDLRMQVFNTLGQEVATLANGRYAGGQHSLTFDASNLTSGVYLVRAQFNGGQALVQKVMLMK
ncbi:S8 family peptidase [bacterium]|nr:S8 family peptidase [bacterium]